MDATCKVQDNIHVFRLVHNMCPGFWVHIRMNGPISFRDLFHSLLQFMQFMDSITNVGVGNC